MIAKVRYLYDQLDLSLCLSSITLSKGFKGNNDQDKEELFQILFLILSKIKNHFTIRRGPTLKTSLLSCSTYTAGIGTTYFYRLPGFIGPCPSTSLDKSIQFFNCHNKKTQLKQLRLYGGGEWIRTTEATCNRFTVCPLWPLGYSSLFTYNNCLYIV